MQTTSSTSGTRANLPARTSASPSPPSQRSSDLTSNSFAENVCLTELLAAQNSDGGWGLRCGHPSAVEPTSWALLALAGSTADHRAAETKAAAILFLRQSQRPDGSWSAAPGCDKGTWVASLACLALAVAAGAAHEVGSGLSWLCDSWPGEGGAWWRIRNRLTGKSHLAGQDHRLRGWGWTEGTSSWVEPTAYALLALRHARGSSAFLTRVDKRCNLAQQMLCNRMCPGGGWNCGNPLVYGVAGDPLIVPTCLALLALGEFAKKDRPRKCISTSLAWLQRAYSTAIGPASLALAHLCLKAFGRKPQSIDSQLAEMYRRNAFLRHVPALAWACLAAQPVPRWLAPANHEGN